MTPNEISITNLPLAGIGLAILAAALLAIGNELQSRGVAKVQARSGADAALGARQFTRLLRNRIWLLGSLAFALSIIVQLASLSLAPLIVVQPVGVTALVFAALLTAILTRHRPSRRVARAILVSIVGVGVFVTVAAIVAEQHPIQETQLVAILIVLAVVLVLLGGVFVLSRVRDRPVHPMVYVLAGGLLTGFVATLGKTVILRVQTVLSTEFHFDAATVLTLFCVLGILVAGGLSVYFVQVAHASNNPELVVAGLTVIDPVVAVALGITILGEAAGAPIWAVIAFVLAGAVAVAGVFLLSAAQNKDAVEASPEPH
ncbi:DMT family transporter [Herbiconiux sp. YIM B11900]|uniref:DMT family transporter n=1 Tax=Herbiconiux sp. YIM B11900 TaxID=3404131 RepID=UPI003F85DA6E